MKLIGFCFLYVYTIAVALLTNTVVQSDIGCWLVYIEFGYNLIILIADRYSFRLFAESCHNK